MKLRRLMMLATLSIAGGLLAGCDSTSTTSPTASTGSSATAPAGPPQVAVATQPDGLGIGEITAGTGATASAGETITVQYTGWLQSTGQEFDSSLNPGRTPFQFQLGAGQVIPGWDEGVAGMKVGGKRELVIPPALGYGAAGQSPSIPPNATLVFEVELVSIP